MICETCKAEGNTSRAYSQGGSYMTLLNCTPFYDEQGRHHYHDSNTTTDNFECSNGHRWTVKSTPSCWCGWPNKREPETASAMRERLGFKPNPEASDNNALSDVIENAGSGNLGYSPPLDGPVLHTRQQVEAMLRTALTDRTPEWTSRTVDERVEILLAMFTLPMKETP